MVGLVQDRRDEDPSHTSIHAAREAQIRVLQEAQGHRDERQQRRPRARDAQEDDREREPRRVEDHFERMETHR